jgi:hypothetical protein
MAVRLKTARPPLARACRLPDRSQAIQKGAGEAAEAW